MPISCIRVFCIEQVHRLIVADDDHRCEGIVSVSDVVRFLVLNPPKKIVEEKEGTTARSLLSAIIDVQIKLQYTWFQQEILAGKIIIIYRFINSFGLSSHQDTSPE